MNMLNLLEGFSVLFVELSYHLLPELLDSPLDRILLVSVNFFTMGRS